MPAKIGLTPKKLKEGMNDVFSRNTNLYSKKVAWCYQFCFFKGRAPSRKDYLKFIEKNKDEYSSFPLVSETSYRDCGFTFCFLIYRSLSDTPRRYEDLALVLYYVYLTGYNENSSKDINVDSLKEIDKRYSSVKYRDQLHEYTSGKDANVSNPYLIIPAYLNFIETLRIDKYSFQSKELSILNVRNVNEDIEKALKERIKSFRKKIGNSQKVEKFEKLVEEIQRLDCLRH